MPYQKMPSAVQRDWQSRTDPHPARQSWRAGVEADSAKKENEMDKKQYGFLARYVDIDMARIVKENQESDFIRVCWKKNTHTTSTVYLVTEKGMDRLRKAQIGNHYVKCNGCLSVSPSGSLTTFNSSDNMKSIYFLFHFMEITDDEFETLFAKLREREERRWPVSVTAIN
jgi:hypothetical protein